ncbi:hypothetical protein [Microbacterium sp. CPCC 204701]|uniref:hypothetical protein n=1 Tax=Microbacterium sp. CPCC 204701 TaxID=2493084 RepID=UPI000FDACE1A|nr:hypothetical protein [Microbacterium sp. CPCC 204701]
MSTRDERRIAVGRRLLLEDALWIGDVLTSALRHDGPARVMAPLLLSGHVSRIVYEGRELLASSNPDVALPGLVALLPPEEHPSIALARHATKMLDNQTSKSKPLKEFEGEIHQAWMSQRALLFRDVMPGFTWLQPDLGFYTLDGYVVGATIPLHMRFGLEAVPPGDYPEYFRRFGEDLIAALRIYVCLSGSADALVTTLELSPVDAVEDNDKFVKRYLKGAYDRALNLDQKLLLLLIESEVNTATTLIPLVTGRHVTAGFRARFISLWHALSSLTKVLDAHPGATSPGRDRLRALVSSTDATRLSAEGMQTVRNRSVHYEIRGKVEIAFSDRPMFGIIESLTDETFESLDSLVRDLSADLRTALREWRES